MRRTTSTSTGSAESLETSFPASRKDRRTLADAMPLRRLTIRRIRRGPALARCRELGLLPGVTVTWLRYEAGKVVVRFPEGSTTAIEIATAPMIEVAPGSSDSGP